MKRPNCFFCNAKIRSGSFCPSCGQPTPNASAEERILWERTQWRSHRQAPAARAAGGDRPRRPTPVLHAVAAQGAVSVNGNGHARAGDDLRVVRVLQRTNVAERPIAAPRTPGRDQPPAPRPAEKPVGTATRTQKKRARARTPAVEPTRAEPRTIAEALSLVDGESIALTLEGWSRLQRATLVITRYRVAIVPRSERWPVRWIPLEEVSNVETGWRGGPTVMIEGSVEVLSFRHGSDGALGVAVEMLVGDVQEARSRRTRRHAGVTQAWLDQVGEVWNSDVGRMRLWVRRHPVFALAATSPVIFFVLYVVRG